MPRENITGTQISTVCFSSRSTVTIATWDLTKLTGPQTTATKSNQWGPSHMANNRGTLKAGSPLKFNLTRLFSLEIRNECLVIWSFKRLSALQWWFRNSYKTQHALSRSRGKAAERGRPGLSGPRQQERERESASKEIKPGSGRARSSERQRRREREGDERGKWGENDALKGMIWVHPFPVEEAEEEQVWIPESLIFKLLNFFFVL